VKLRTVATLLAVWCVLIVLPAFLVVALFTDSDPDDPITGWIFLIWIVGYLAQLGVFMAASRKSGRNAVLGWLIASLGPWAADWSAPVARWGPVIVLVIAAAYSAWFYSGLKRSADLQVHGIPATGTVLEVKKPMMNMIINSIYLRRTMRLRIERSDGTPPYEATYSGTFMLGELPTQGSVFNLRVDPKNPNHFETTDGAASTPVDFAGTAGWASSRLPPSQPQDIWNAPDATIGDQLQHLADLHSRGDLTDAEFASAKSRLLGNGAG
jgi:Short C-terminal domain